MERDDAYYDIYYYTDDRIDESKENESRFRGQPDDVSNFENPRTPRALGSLEEVVRKRCPTWMSKVLKTHIRDDVSLEDLFANCWFLYVCSLADRLVYRDVLPGFSSRHVCDLLPLNNTTGVELRRLCLESCKRGAMKGMCPRVPCRAILLG